MLPTLAPFMRRTFATLSREAGVDAHTRTAQLWNTVDVNENEYALASFEKEAGGRASFGISRRSMMAWGVREC